MAVVLGMGIHAAGRHHLRPASPDGAEDLRRQLAAAGYKYISSELLERGAALLCMASGHDPQALITLWWDEVALANLSGSWAAQQAVLTNLAVPPGQGILGAATIKEAMLRTMASLPGVTRDPIFSDQLLTFDVTTLGDVTITMERYFSWALGRPNIRAPPGQSAIVCKSGQRHVVSASNVLLQHEM